MIIIKDAFSFFFFFLFAFIPFLSLEAFVGNNSYDLAFLRVDTHLPCLLIWYALFAMLVLLQGLAILLDWTPRRISITFNVPIKSPVVGK